jgi:hypothetical protein
MNPKTVTALLAVVALSGCNAQQQPWRNLKSQGGIPYIVGVRFFDDGDKSHRPFELRVSSKSDQKSASHVMFAEQCKNVSVAQTARELYIFYDRLDLRGFSNFRGNEILPRPFLCDLGSRVCRELMAVTKANNAPMDQLC